ncbi:MAG: hypothetical protein QOJ99_874 [Bryobacterales bacterium]|nr:hypothetical protein [Bryobacterales bacterium]
MKSRKALTSLREAKTEVSTWTYSMSRAHRKPMFVVELSGVFDVRAATRYRLQYEPWQRYDPPRMDLVWPPEGPTGFERVARR